MASPTIAAKATAELRPTDGSFLGRCLFREVCRFPSGNAVAGRRRASSTSIRKLIRFLEEARGINFIPCRRSVGASSATSSGMCSGTLFTSPPPIMVKSNFVSQLGNQYAIYGNVIISAFRPDSPVMVCIGCVHRFVSSSLCSKARLRRIDSMLKPAPAQDRQRAEPLDFQHFLNWHGN